MQLLARMQPRPIPGELEQYRVTENMIGKPWDFYPLRPLVWVQVALFYHPLLIVSQLEFLVSNSSSMRFWASY